MERPDDNTDKLQLVLLLSLLGVKGVMKKHIGMSKSSNAVELQQGVRDQIGKLVHKYMAMKIDGDVPNLEATLKGLLLGSSINEQINSVKQLTSMALTNQEMLTVACDLIACLYFDQSLYKTALHKVVGSQMEAVGKISPTFEGDVTSLITHMTNEKELIFCTKSLLGSPTSSLKYQVIANNVIEYLVTISKVLIRLLGHLNGEGARSDSCLDVIHDAAQLHYRLLSMAGKTDTITSMILWSELKAACISTMSAGLGNMDLQITIGLCFSKMIYMDHRLQVTSDYLSKVSDLLGGTLCDNSFLKICFLNGVVSSAAQGSLDLHEVILNSTQNLLKISSAMLTAAKLVFMKMMTSWTSSLCKYGHNQFVKDRVFHCLFTYLFHVWEDSTEVIRQSAREVLSNLFRSVKHDESLVLHSLTTISSYPWTRKGKYGFLVECVTVFGPQSTIEFICNGSTQDLLNIIVKCIEEQRLANYVSEFFCCLLKKDKEAAQYSCSEWLDRWLIPLVKALEIRPKSQRHIQQNLLPRIIKLWPQAIIELLKWLSKQDLSHAESWLDIYLMLAGQSRSSGLLDNFKSTEELWSSVLSEDIISRCLHSSISERRLSAFALVCQSHKTSKPISNQEFEWVECFIRVNSFHSEPSFRQQMTSYLKHFFYRVLESRNKINEQERQVYEGYLRKIGNTQLERLQQNGTANHRSVALEIVSLMTQIL